MLDWLKDKIKQGTDAGERILVAKAMREHFATLEKIKGARPGIGDRLARYVTYGEDQNALQEIAAAQSGSQLGKAH